MNFKNLAIATTALVALAACNNSDNVPSLAKEEASVNILIDVPATRGVITDPSDKKIVISNIAGRIFKGGNTLATAKTDVTGTTYKLTLGPVLVDGSESVQVVLNNDAASTEVGIDKIQPTDAKGNLQNAIYVATAKGLGTSTEVNGKNVYTVKADAKSIAARLEVKGAPKFKQELVKSMDISYFAPVDYSVIYGQLTTVTLPSNSALKMDVTKVQADAINTGGKVLANHLFNGDLASAVVGFKIEKYSCLLNAEGAYVVKEDGGAKYYVYETEAKTYVVNKGAVNAPKYFEATVVKDAAGKYSVDIAKTETTNNVVLAMKTDIEYFSLANFGNTKDKRYEGGNIYRLNLETGMKWNKEGSNEYNPEDKTGTDDPDKTKDKKEASIDVEVTVLEWNDVNTNVEVE